MLANVEGGVSDEVDRSSLAELLHRWVDLAAEPLNMLAPLFRH